jgi:hypothetical protein
VTGQMDKILQPLDLIFTWQHSSQAPDVASIAIGETIEAVTRGPSHVRLYINDDVFWEFTVPTCRWGHLQEIDLAHCDLEIGYHVFTWRMTPEHRERIVEEAKRLIGTPYDIPELWEQLLHEWGIDDADDSRKDRFVCSSGVEHVFRHIGLGFRPHHSLVSPEDIRESPDYGIRWQWGKAPLEA